GVKAFSSGAKIASTGSKMLRVGDDLLGGGKLAIKNAGKEFQGTIDNGIQAGKRAIGKTIEEKGFMSTTSLKNQEFSGDVTLVINAPKGSKGAYLGHFSNSPKEAEILFNAGQKMLVKDVKITGDKLEVLVDLL
ncbi:ADP-ribosyltransferase, partial [Listeria seeligeri]|uniref:ADP-ribosyltransferase n=1 Tax=Listeria seeligeri TaxID=1640 RepID=UPI0022EC1391